MRDADGQPSKASPAWLGHVAFAAGSRAQRFAIFMFSLAGIPPLLGFLGEVRQVFDAAVHAGLFRFAAVGIAASVIGAFYYLKIVKTMYFDEPARAFSGRSYRRRSDRGCRAGRLTAAAISPLGWPLLGLSRGLHRFCREGAVLTATIRTVAETGSTNMDVAELARSGASEGLWLRAERQTSGKGRQGKAWDSLRPAISTSRRWSACGPASLHPRRWHWSRRSRSKRLYRCSGVQSMLKWPNDLLLDGAKLSGILLERVGMQ
jgi:hypothetical protein